MTRKQVEAMVAQVQGQILAVRLPSDDESLEDAFVQRWAEDRARNVCAGLLGNYMIVPLPEERTEPRIQLRRTEKAS